MSHPYRGLAERDIVTAPTRDGTAHLELGPDAALLSLEARWRVAIARDHLVLEKPLGRRRRSVRVAGARVAAARPFPAGGLGLWYEVAPSMRRLAGLRPAEMLDSEGLQAARALERLGGKLRAELAGREPTVEAASEYGEGPHRVLLIDTGLSLELYARPLFREHPRPLLEVRPGGGVVTYRRGGRKRRARARAHDIVVGGDLIRFVDDRGEDRARVALPWIGMADREEIARGLGERLLSEP